jgi:hypothetical protein
LEECLNSSNETVTQLKHQLQQRSDLLNTVCSLGDDYYQQEEAAKNDQIVEKLQKKIRQLEDESSNLRLETTSLKEFICEVESQSQDKIDQYLKQLETANLKIHKLHSQIADKNTECSFQATEIQKLVREIQNRKSSEKMLKEATTDLNSQLNAAISAHDQLKSEILILQEVYTDVRERLHEAEEELGAQRIQSGPHRIGSSDSLYDSLASELGGNDSGFFSTPMISARTNDSGQSSSSEFCSPGSALAEEIEKLKKGEIVLDEYEIPSKALIDSVRNNRKLREKSPSLADELMPSTAEIPIIVPPKLEAIAEAQTPLSEQPGSLLAINEIPQPSSLSRPLLKSSISSETDPEDPELRLIEEDCCRRPSTSSTSSPSAPITNQKIYRDSSCSPIPSLLFDWPLASIATTITKSTTNNSGSSSPQSKPCGIAQPSPRAPKQSVSIDSEEETTPRAPFQQQRQPMTSESSTSSISESNIEDAGGLSRLIKADSNDSLNKYTGPKLGEPGKPGTRDLEFSLRKLKLRKQCPKCSSFFVDVGFPQKPLNIQKIERDYQKFREARGLPPSIHGFFTNLSMEQQPKPQKLCGPLSSQLEYLLSSPDETKPQLFKQNFLSTTLALRPKTIWLKPSGLTAAITSTASSSEGIIQRAEVTSPESPKSADSTPKKFSQNKNHRSSLLSAIGLNNLIDSDPESPSKTTSIFRSPFLFGPYQAYRELSPPFAGTALSDGLELIHSQESQSSTAI